MPRHTFGVLVCLVLTAAPARAQDQGTDQRGSAVPRASLSGPWFIPQTAPQPPEPRHTGFKALILETGRDFKAFPRRSSTWVILGIGAGAAAAAYPADDEVNAHLMGSDAVHSFFAPGKWIGSGYVQAGTAVGLYVVAGMFSRTLTARRGRTRSRTSVSTCFAH